MPKSLQNQAKRSPFSGFEHLTSNFLYCPNQFLDVCLPSHSRSVVRLVAFILDQTLGWLDKNGNPISQDITVSYRQLIASAGISRGSIRKAIDDAIAADFIDCIETGMPSTNGQRGQNGSFALRWDHRSEYQKEAKHFQGFYAGEGHRTPIPNSFFRKVIPCETLVVTKVVGTVLRHTVGYQNQFGGRRSQAPLSYRFIQSFANIPDPKSLSTGISSAIASNYIVCVEEGHFHPEPAKRKPSSYAIKWLGDEKMLEGGSKYPAARRFNKPSSPPVQNTQQDQSKNPSNSGPENPAETWSNKPSKEKTKQKHTLKQQHKDTVAVVNSKAIQLLRDEGFDAATAQSLSLSATHEQIEQQIAWLPHRNTDHNRLGMLRCALEENWSQPDRHADAKTLIRKRREQDRQQDLEEEQANQKLLADKMRRVRQRDNLRATWEGLSKNDQKRIKAAAYEKQNGEVLRKLFRANKSHRLRECVRQLDRETNQVKS